MVTHSRRALPARAGCEFYVIVRVRAFFVRWWGRRAPDNSPMNNDDDDDCDGMYPPRGNRARPSWLVDGFSPRSFLRSTTNCTVVSQ